jgi:signal-transduction protein with cAMP-binding, CBS, and nucleotidyltransferase domain
MSEQAVQALMSTDFLTVYLTQSMQDVYPQLTGQADRFVVVLDDEDVPLHLTTADEMRRKMPRSLEWPSVGDLAARLPEALLVDEKATIDQAMVLFGTMFRLEPQPRGVVVMRDTEVAGILPYAALNDYYSEHIVPESIAQGQVVRKGQPITVASAVFRCRRYPRCSFEIKADLVDEPPLCGITAAHGRTKLHA